ncbi:cytochrome P450 4e3-like [Condylostylus longicornis]|uniref:cytochrome P450 4e3-like n=1 Tax=Condylostylus longicornis TaxID=2530218 RepID=UPI00244E00AA|nr:cytochrome P450 4e3-like [Condylostylus longicornis]
MLVFLITFLIIFITTYCLYKYHIQWKYIEKFPGPTPIPIIGNTHQLGLNPVAYLSSFLKFWHEYNHELFRVWVGRNPFIIVSDAKDIEFILSSNTLIDKANAYKLLHPWLGQGLLTSTGIKWFKHRKMITPSFHFKILIDFHDVIKERSKKFVDNLKLKAATKEIFDIQDKIHYTTLDVICETAMGTAINALENNNSQVVKSFQDLCYVVQNRIFNPFMQIPMLFHLYKESSMQKNALNILRAFSMDVIEKRRILLEENSSTEENLDSSDTIGKRKQVFLDTLLTSTIDDKPLTNEEIYEEVQTFMFEGHDTTTSGITFTIYLLSRHPEIQQKVYEEQKLLFGNELKNIDPSYQDVQGMKYLEMVIKEAQRLYPSVPLIGRKTNETVNMNGNIIPAGSTLLLFVFAMGYKKEYFPDPYKFDPERFNSDREKTNPFEYVPFSAGPRNCIGQKFAMLEMKSIVSHIVRNFIILPPNDECLNVNGNYENLGKFDYDPVLASVLTLKAEYGVQIRLENR